MLSTWRHSGFHVFCGNRISPTDDTAMENLARYIIRASFSQERMQYLDQEGKVVYSSKDGRTSKSFPAMEWLVAMSSHIPNRGEQMVRYYGWYSNVSRGKWQREDRDDLIPCILEPLGDEKIFRRNWARLIQKIYEADPLVCPKCQGVMRIVSNIEDPSVIRAILKHLGIWLIRSRPPPKTHDPPVCIHKSGRPAAPHIMDDLCCQLPINDDHLYSDPEYSCDEYIQA
ncbi:MAG: transposase [Proteobacteria bacterium]|nr:transposase [Pseudomonadota bacterium]